MKAEITGHEKAEEKIRHLNLVLRTIRTIRNVNRLITQERDREKLLKGVCKSLTEARRLL